MAYSVEDMLVVVLLLRQPDRLQSIRRKFFHLLRPVGQFPPIQEFDPRGCVSGSRTILLDMSRPGGRGYRSRCRNEKSAPAGIWEGKCDRSRKALATMTRATSLPRALLWLQCL